MAKKNNPMQPNSQMQNSLNTEFAADQSLQNAKAANQASHQNIQKSPVGQNNQNQQNSFNTEFAADQSLQNAKAANQASHQNMQKSPNQNQQNQ